MPSPFDHVLLTRFSAVLGGDDEPAPVDWLYYRLGFFLDACHSSVTRQQAAAFDWLVLLDDRCPDAFREDVEELAVDAFTPIWTRERFRRDAFARPVADLLESRSPAPHLITTRIDSDDAMAVDYMASVQAEFARQERLFVSFTRGVQIDRAGAVYLSDTLSNPFLSLIERRIPETLPDTVYVAKHAQARAHGPIREVRAPVMWAQVVHGVNLSNIVNGTRVSPAAVRERFDMELTYDTQISGPRLLAARARHETRLVRLWSAHPGELTKLVEARTWRAHGTHERAQDDGATLTDRVQGWEQHVAQGWAESGLRRRAVSARRTARQWAWRVKAAVNSAAPERTEIVAGDLDAVLASDRVVILAEWSPGGLRDSALAAARAYTEVGYAVLVVSAREPWSRLRVDEHALPLRTAVLRRPNVAYDFGSWRAALGRFPALAAKGRVILTNDSLVGPFAPLDEVVSRIESAQAHVWGATVNRWPSEHLQSYLMAFRDGVLADPPLADFFAGVRQQESKRDVVLAYELGLTRVVDDAGLSRAVGWSPEELGLPPYANSLLAGWRQLLDAGLPFVKRSLLTERGLTAERDLVVDYVSKKYGTTPRP